MDGNVRFTAPEFDLHRIDAAAVFLLDILGKIHDHHTWFTCMSDVESFFDNTSQFFPPPDSDRVFTDAPCDAYNINFLECVVSDEAHGHLTGEAYQWDTVIIRCCNSGDKICGARAARHQAHPGLFCGTGISVGRMNQALFMARENDMDTLFSIQCVK